jgi:hypothetical protein
MIYRGRLDGAAAAASLKDSSVSLAVGEGYVVAWDLGGRLYSVFRGGHTFRRGLSGRVLHKWRDAFAAPEAESAYDERQRVVLGEAEGDRLLDECARLAQGAAAAMRRSPSAWTPSLSRDVESTNGTAARLLAALDLCGQFDADGARADAARFAQVYSPIGILPPDQYMSVVLQATSGCSFGTCTFCDLYHGPYRVKTAVEFARHIDAVHRYLGPSLSLRARTVFLGAANALAVPLPRLVELLGVLHTVYDGSPPPVCGFVDGFTGALKDAEAYRMLAEMGLARVYIGLESGHDPLLAFVRKPGSSAEALQTVRAIKEAGVAVGVIVMIGLGGHRFAEQHVADTIDTVNAMALSARDLLYFSDLVPVPGTSYPATPSAVDHRKGPGFGPVVAQDLQPLGQGERIAQLRAIRTGLRFPGPPPKFARYDIREFVY